MSVLSMMRWYEAWVRADPKKTIGLMSGGEASACRDALDLAEYT